MLMVLKMNLNIITNMKNDLNLIWCLKSQYEIDFSWEWINEIFSNFNLVHHYDIENKFEKEIDNSVIVVCVKQNPNLDLIQYLQRYDQQNLNYTILHLSDEAFDQNVDFYNYSKKIIRNYYNEDYSQKYNILTIPLGYQSQIRKVDIDKQISINFVGQIKSDRGEMLQVFHQLPNNFIHLTNQWNDPKGLDVHRFSNILSRSYFTLCPRGWVCMDSFRINEALECNSIPVSIKDTNGKDYFELIYGNHPFIIGDTWNDAFEKVLKVKPHDKLEEVKNWWTEYKSSLKSKIEQFIKN